MLQCVAVQTARLLSVAREGEALCNASMAERLAYLALNGGKRPPKPCRGFQSHCVRAQCCRALCWVAGGGADNTWRTSELGGVKQATVVVAEGRHKRQYFNDTLIHITIQLCYTKTELIKRRSAPFFREYSEYR